VRRRSHCLEFILIEWLVTFNQESEPTLGFHTKKRVQSSLRLPSIFSFPTSYLLPPPLLISYIHGFMFARICGADRIVLICYFNQKSELTFGFHTKEKSPKQSPPLFYSFFSYLLSFAFYRCLFIISMALCLHVYLASIALS